MNIEISDGDGITVVMLSGNLNSSNSGEFEEPVLQKIREGHRYMLLNLEHCDFISSAGIRVILICAKLIQTEGGKLVLTGLNEYISRVFEISGLPSILTIVPDPSEALSQLRAAVKS